MKRSVGNTSDSLELLLDAICNTFGAVLFISMLVAILVSLSSSNDSGDESQLEAARIALAVERAESELNRIERELQNQRDVVGRLGTTDSLELASRIEEQEKAHLAHIQSQANSTRKSTDLNRAAVDLQSQLRRQEARSRAVTKEHSDLKQQLESQSTQGRTARVPKLKRTSKTPFVFALDDRRLFKVTTNSGAVNEPECLKKKNLAGVIEIQPNPGRGLTVDAAKPGQLDSKLSGIDTQRSFIQLFVARDSFEQFLPVKDAMVRQGIEYEIIVMDGDSVVLYLGDSARESFVQ